MSDGRFQKGNQAAAEARRWQAAVDRALEKRSRRDQIEALDAIAELYVDQCLSGDMLTIKDLADRMDGKPKQAIVGGDEGDSPVRVSAVVEYVNPTPG